MAQRVQQVLFILLGQYQILIYQLTMMMIFASKQCQDPATQHRHCPPNCVIHNHFITSLRKYSKSSLSLVRSAKKTHTLLRDKQNMAKRTPSTYIRPFKTTDQQQKTQKKQVNNFHTHNSPPQKYIKKQQVSKLHKSKQKGEIENLLMKVSLQKNKQKETKNVSFSRQSKNIVQVSPNKVFKKHIIYEQPKQDMKDSQSQKSQKQVKAQIQIEDNNQNQIFPPNPHAQFFIVKAKQFNQLENGVERITNIIDMFNKRIENSSHKSQTEQKIEQKPVISDEDSDHITQQFQVNKNKVQLPQKQNKYFMNQIIKIDHGQKLRECMRQGQLSFSNISPIGQPQPDLKIQQKKQILFSNPYEISPYQHPKYKIPTTDRIAKEMSKQQSTNNQKVDEGKLNYKMFNWNTKSVSALNLISSRRKSNKDNKKCHGSKIIF